MDLTAQDVARFWTKVDVRGAEDCWPWLAGVVSVGYGQFFVRSRGANVGAHRVAAFLFHGPPPSDKPFALHSCDNRICCNPAHLRYGTPADNMRDRDERGRKAYGTQMPQSKLTPEVVRAIRDGLRAGLSKMELGRRFGISPTTVYDVATGKTWRHVQ